MLNPFNFVGQSTAENIANGTVSVSTIRSHVRRVLGVKGDLGLFSNPYIPADIDPYDLVASHVPLTLEAAHKSIILLENRNKTLPLNPAQQDISKIALIGPFGDILNYGDYSGQWGTYPSTSDSSTIRQGLMEGLAAHNSSGVQVLTSMGSNTWLYNGQYGVPAYLLSTPNGTAGGLQATYYADTNFSTPLVQKIEVPALDWGLYPPPGLPSNNFSVVWEGNLDVPVEGTVQGFIGVAVSANTTATLYVDDIAVAKSNYSESGTILGNIEPLEYSQANATIAPPGAASFQFEKDATHKVRIEVQAWNTYQKIANVASLNTEVIFWWNLVDQVDPVGKVLIPNRPRSAWNS